MDPKRDYTPNDEVKKTLLSSFFCCFALSAPPGRPTLAPPTVRVDRRLVVPPCPLLRQPLRRHNHDIPHLCAGLVHVIRSSLLLGWGAVNVEYMGGTGGSMIR